MKKADADILRDKIIKAVQDATAVIPVVEYSIKFPGQIIIFVYKKGENIMNGYQFEYYEPTTDYEIIGDIVHAIKKGNYFK